MKKIHYIILTTTLFIILFYNESIGVNMSVLGLFLSVATFVKTPSKMKTKLFWVTFILSIISSFSFAWYGDFSSFLSLGCSLLFMNYQTKSTRMNILLAFPAFVINLFTFVCRFFNFQTWVPQNRTKGIGQKLLSFVIIPLFFVLMFIGVYSMGSSHFSSFISGFEWNFDGFQFFFLLMVGFFIAFNYWDFTIEKTFYKINHLLVSTFKTKPLAYPTWSFMEIDAERTSGVMSLLALNILTFFFLITFNYELFYETPKSATELSLETHERVNAVILSIVMAILFILFYFKSHFNFDKKSKTLKILAHCWLLMNSALVISTMLKNSEYILNFGMTYKRWGVYAFLILALLGLMFTMIKILKRKTNAYLFNRMAWSLYGMLILVAIINWGGISTRYNINNKKGNFDYLKTLHFNHQLLKDNFPNQYEMYMDYKCDEDMSRARFLSKIGYYETLD